MNENTLAKTLNILEELISFDTVALTPNLDLINYAEKYLSDLGARIILTHSSDGERANLFASFGPAIDGGLVLSGHSEHGADPGAVRGRLQPADPVDQVLRQRDVERA